MEKNGIITSCELLVIGGSSGSLDVVLKILSSIKQEITFAIVIVVHRKTAADSTLFDLLTARCVLPVREIEDKDSVIPGLVYLAPPNYHLLFEKKHVFALDDSEKVNYSRPSIDVTFESAADAYASSVVAILLSGANADGTDGLKAIHKQDGMTVVQRPDTATFPFMPQQAILYAQVDYEMSVEEMIEFVNSR